MKKVKMPVEIRLEYKSFDKKLGETKNDFNEFELIQTRPAVNLMGLMTKQKSNDGRKSKPNLLHPPSIQSSQTQAIVNNLISNLPYQRISSKSSDFNQQLHEDWLKLDNSLASVSAITQSLQLKYSKKFKQALLKSLEQSHSLHTQQLASIKIFYKTQIAKYKALKRIMQSCLDPNSLQNLNTHTHSLLLENLSLKKTLKSLSSISN